MIELSIERVARHRGTVAQDNDLHSGSSDGHIHATQVAKETNLSLIVRAYQRDDDDVALLTLETINGIHADACPERFYPFFLPDLLTQKLHLGPIG